MTTARSLLSQARHHGRRLTATMLLLSLPTWSGCFTPTATTISHDHITNTAARSSSYAVEIPQGYTAQAIPEYLPHVPFTPQWLATDEAAAFADFAPRQALEQKLYADHQLYHRPNYRAYFSISGEDFLLTPTDQADALAPSPFFVFTVIHTRDASGRYVFPGLGSGNLGTFGNWVAGSLRSQHANVSLSQRSILGRQWVWLNTVLPYPFPSATYSPLNSFDASEADTSATSVADSHTSATHDSSESPSPPPPTESLLTSHTADSSHDSPDAESPQSWNFVYVATAGSGGTLYTIQGWSLPNDHAAMMNALDTMITSINLRPQFDEAE